MNLIKRFLGAGDRLSSSLLEGRRKIVLVASVFIIGAVCCGIYSTTLGPYNNWDLRNYHHYSAYALLTGRFDFDYAPAQIQSFLNPLPYVPFYLLTTHLKPVVAAFILGGIHGLVVGFLFLTAMAFFSSSPPLTRIAQSLLCAAVGAYGPLFLAFVGGSSADNIASIFIIAGIYVTIRAIKLHGATDARESRLALLIGGVLIGIAAGLKLVCAVFLVGYGIAVFITGRGIKSNLAATGLFGAAGAVGILISRGYWMALLWSRFGSPLFPFYNRIFRSPYYYNKNFSDDRYLPKTLKNAFLMPIHFITRSNFINIRDIRYALVYGLILLCLAALAIRLVMLLLRPHSKFRMPDRAGLFLLVFFVASFMIWQMKFAILRYTAPMELVAPILIIFLISVLFPWKYPRRILTIAAFASIVLIMQPRKVLHKNYWPSDYIEVKAPRLRNPWSTLIIMADNEPWSYVIPAFHPEVRFVGLASNFSYPSAKTQHRAADEMFDLVKSHEGKIYILSSANNIEKTLKRLKPYNIETPNLDAKRNAMRKRKPSKKYLEQQGVLPVITKQEMRKLHLWPVELK